MISNNTDKILRDELVKLQDIPDGVKWNAEYGWKQYKKKYVSKINRKLKYWLSAVAVILIFVATFIVMKYVNTNDNNIIQFASDIENKREILLHDGSKIWLNYNSSVKINLKSAKIEVEGEAYFELTGKQEYSISSPHSSYKAGDCAFNLKSREKEDGALLTVSAGQLTIIWVSDITDYFIVEAGNQAKIVPHVAIVKTPTFDANYLAWKNEELHFNDTPLYFVFDKLEELNDIRIDVTDKDIRYCRITSDFKTLSAMEVLQKISEYFNYHLEYKGNIFLIEGEGCDI
jgi:transmembrane sensor